MNDDLIAELNRGVTLIRVDAADIYRRARAAALIDRLVREERTRRSVSVAAELVQWLAFDGVAAALAWAGTGSVLVCALAASAVHLAGMAMGASRAARV